MCRGFLLPRNAFFLLLGSLFLAAAVILAVPGLGNSNGAPAGAATTGCTCHGPQPSAEADVGINGLSDHVQGGSRYQMTVVVTGPEPLPAPVGGNQGGFALSVDLGTLEPLDETSQVKDGMLTHTSAGNDQRSWNFQWITPAAGGSATFSIAGNAVNGDGANNLLDAWTKRTIPAPVLPAHEASTPTSPSAAPAGESSGVGAVLAGAALAVGAAVLARRRP